LGRGITGFFVIAPLVLKVQGLLKALIRKLPISDNLPHPAVILRRKKIPYLVWKWEVFDLMITRH
jgi:hypothetical protein